MTQKSTVQQDKQRSDLLKKQLTQMNQDFEFMKKNRDEWKKQLDARFQDIERQQQKQNRKIQNSKQFITNQAKRTNDTLLAFQHKFEHELANVKDDLTKRIDQEAEQTKNRFAQKNQQIEDINKNLNEEKKERRQQHQEGMKQTRQKTTKLSEGLQKQKQARIKSQKQNMGKINQSLFILKQQLKQEKDERNLKINELRKYTDSQLSSQRKFNQQFHNKCFKDFKENLDDLRKQMNERFSSKDQIINSISKVVKTLQDTLRHPS